MSQKEGENIKFIPFRLFMDIIFSPLLPIQKYGIIFFSGVMNGVWGQADRRQIHPGWEPQNTEWDEKDALHLVTFGSPAHTGNGVVRWG